MEMTRTLIVPGLDGAPAPHWQHWWAVTDPRALRVDLNDPAVCDRAPSHEARA
ncbi:MAG: alpha/beta hydrolase [Tabrizicola sp.]|nr:alpha/beta hydrolase [Tabrizicola sp.]MCC6517520.1 alpha/beta hydrolase [Tabrizicola sp.]